MALLALHEQLCNSEWWPAERLAALQLRQLAVLLSHASRSVPHYRATFQTDWDYKKFAGTLKINYTGSYNEDPTGGDLPAGPPPP